MRKKTILISVCAAVVLSSLTGLALYKYAYPQSIKISGSAQFISNNQNIINKIYDANFIFDHTSINTAKIFLPQYTVTEEAAADFYAKKFGFNDEFKDFDDYFLYANESGKLYIDKYSSFIWYEKKQAAESGEMLTEAAIIEKAENFLNEKMIDVEYKKLAINFDGSKYTVKVITDLQGYGNYAFPAVLTFSPAGELVSMDFYYFNYDRIDTVNLKTMKQAYNELPVDFGEGIKIDLKSCKIVYIYEESVVQPAYLFEGEISGGNTFQCFVKAAKYN